MAPTAVVCTGAHTQVQAQTCHLEGLEPDWGYMNYPLSRTRQAIIENCKCNLTYVYEIKDIHVYIINSTSMGIKILESIIDFPIAGLCCLVIYHS